MGLNGLSSHYTVQDRTYSGGFKARMWLSIGWELEKSDSESVLRGLGDGVKWQPDLHPLVAIVKMIFSTTKYVHLQVSQFLMFV